MLLDLVCEERSDATGNFLYVLPSKRAQCDQLRTLLTRLVAAADAVPTKDPADIAAAIGAALTGMKHPALRKIKFSRQLVSHIDRAPFPTSQMHFQSRHQFLRLRLLSPRLL